MNGKSLKETCTPATISPAAPASKASHLTAVCCVGVCYGNAGPEPHISVGYLWGQPTPICTFWPCFLSEL